MKTLRDLVQQRIVILDGAMGTMIQKYGLTEDDFRGTRFRDATVEMKGNNDMLNLTRPDVIREILREYLLAGADIITTNTFSSQRVSQADYHLEDCCREMAYEGARLAREEADKVATSDHPRFVAGSVGPTNKTCSMSPDVSDPAARDLTYDELFDAYTEEIGALIEGGVDAIIVETVFDSLNCKIAIDAALQERERAGKPDLPIMVSVTISDLAGRTLSGQTLDAFMASISSYPIFSVGLNCSFGAPQMLPYLRELASRAPYYISAYPNAGLPNSMGEYDETPESMAPEVAKFMEEGLVNIVGGCCGTTPEFIRAYLPYAAKAKPHVPAPKPTTMWLSGLELLDVTPEVRFVNVGERCNVAGSRKFLRLIKEKNYEEALTIARKQVADGALVIDVNMDDGLLDAKEEMVHFLNMIASEPEIAKVPVMIDSSKWDVIVAGLKTMQGKCIVNSISLKEGEEKFIAHARDVKRFGAAVVVMCFDEVGQATTYERKIEIAERSYRILVDKVGMNPLDIIFDPNILSIATGLEEHDNYAVDFIQATGWIKQHLPGAHVSGGVSNLSFSFRGINAIREAMHAVFLYYATQQGMDFGIVNPATKITYADIPEDELKIIEDVVLNRRKGAAENLIELAEQKRQEAAAAKAAREGGAGTAAAAPEEEAWRKESLDDRLAYALRKGIGNYLDEDLHEALKQYPHAVNIIEDPLMRGMNIVGDLFGSGKMFLPQVVKTARTMKQAVAILQPYIEAEKTEGVATAGKVLLATVKGDVHDIGKNIVGVIFACNNYEVIDLGVMVPPEQIVKKAKEEHVDFVGLSGLITPSLDEMVHTAEAMKAAGLTIPILIGGATTSALHVALKIAPVYDGPVIWTKDASQPPLIAANLMDPQRRPEYIAELKAAQQQLRDDYAVSQGQKKEKLSSLEAARANKLDLFS
ncbi:methionine synthase [Prevotella sp. AGR2160]|uniref:methionine synthase n=1 Tax=Prevotella sp. AGR2160 TaxID=1280674 RepID=UPI000425B131|nr:methionine synthase [Prevotella sp. AGR2160]